jgi:riboflavin synthase
VFTGIVEAVGRIERVQRGREGLRLVVDAGRLRLANVRVGDSVCVQGACLTVVAKRGRKLGFDVSRETLDCTSGLDRPGAVNLERSLRLGDPLGGHLVTGHVDGIGEVVSFEDAGESKRLRVRVPRALAKFVARKGSICVDGVSLTVNRIASSVVDINLIPHTLEATTLSGLARGAKVNLEIDLVARYVERVLAR